jgi:hypothetical protein
MLQQITLCSPAIIHFSPGMWTVLEANSHPFCSLRTVFEANSLSVPQSEDRSGGKVHICTAV